MSRPDIAVLKGINERELNQSIIVDEEYGYHTIELSTTMSADQIFYVIGEALSLSDAVIGHLMLYMWFQDLNGNIVMKNISRDFNQKYSDFLNQCRTMRGVESIRYTFIPFNLKNNSVVENGHRISEYDATCIRKLDIFVADDRLRRWRQRVVERKQKKSLKRKFSDEIGDRLSVGSTEVNHPASSSTASASVVESLEDHTATLDTVEDILMEFLDVYHVYVRFPPSAAISELVKHVRQHLGLPSTRIVSPSSDTLYVDNKLQHNDMNVADYSSEINTGQSYENTLENRGRPIAGLNNSVQSHVLCENTIREGNFENSHILDANQTVSDQSHERHGINNVENETEADTRFGSQQQQQQDLLRRPVFHAVVIPSETTSRRATTTPPTRSFSSESALDSYNCRYVLSPPTPALLLYYVADGKPMKLYPPGDTVSTISRSW